MKPLLGDVFSRVWQLLKEAHCEISVSRVTSETGEALEGVEVTQFGVVIGRGQGTSFRRAAMMAFIEAVQQVHVPPPARSLAGVPPEVSRVSRATLRAG